MKYQIIKQNTICSKVEQRILMMKLVTIMKKYSGPNVIPSSMLKSFKLYSSV